MANADARRRLEALETRRAHIAPMARRGHTAAEYREALHRYESTGAASADDSDPGMRPEYLAALREAITPGPKAAA